MNFDLKTVSAKVSHFTPCENTNYASFRKFRFEKVVAFQKNY